jgi:hypothetical protein
MSLKQNDTFAEAQKENKDELDAINAELQVEAEKQKQKENENPYNHSFKQDLTPLASIVKSIFGDWNN